VADLDLPEITDAHRRRFRTALLDWYHNVKREMPWRNTDDPYRIWVSEIMLQQTRVDQAEPYYQRFTNAFPTVHDLADADREHKDAARKFVGEFSARGGTNIAEALSQAAGLNPGESGRPFVVVFLTDGQGNRSADEIMSTVKSAAGDASLRIFPFGVGHEVNTKLLDRLANEYTGRPTYVQPGEDLELVLGDFFGTISHPVLTDLELDLPDIRVTERFPVSLGDLYHGQRLTIAGKFAEPPPGASCSPRSARGRRSSTPGRTWRSATRSRRSTCPPSGRGARSPT